MTANPGAQGMLELPAIPDDDADFTPELARKIISKYQELLHTASAPVQGALTRDVILRGLADFFSESKHLVWSSDEISDCLVNMINRPTCRLCGLEDGACICAHISPVPVQGEGEPVAWASNLLTEFKQSLASVNLLCGPRPGGKSKDWLDGQDRGLRQGLHIAKTIAEELLAHPSPDRPASGPITTEQLDKLQFGRALHDRPTSGPMVPWKLNCQQAVCGAPECDCPAVSAQERVREATIKECELAARGPTYKEIYNGHDGHNWSRDSDYGRGRHAAADAVYALAALPEHDGSAVTRPEGE